MPGKSPNKHIRMNRIPDMFKKLNEVRKSEREIQYIKRRNLDEINSENDENETFKKHEDENEIGLKSKNEIENEINTLQNELKKSNDENRKMNDENEVKLMKNVEEMMKTAKEMKKIKDEKYEKRIKVEERTMKSLKMMKTEGIKMKKENKKVVKKTKPKETLLRKWVLKGPTCKAKTWVDLPTMTRVSPNSTGLDVSRDRVDNTEFDWKGCPE